MNSGTKKPVRILALVFLCYFAVFTILSSYKTFQLYRAEQDRDEKQLIGWFVVLVVISLLPFIVLNVGIFKSRDAAAWDWGKLATIFFLAVCPSVWLLTKIF